MEENRLLRYFQYAHLPEPLQRFSRPFYDIAQVIAGSDSHDPAEQTVALRKLLEAKDAWVRANLPK